MGAVGKPLLAQHGRQVRWSDLVDGLGGDPVEDDGNGRAAVGCLTQQRPTARRPHTVPPS
jgi:hypothetical protein